MTSYLSILPRATATALLAVVLSGCLLPQQNRLHMVANPETGLLYGSTIERNVLTDPTFYNNRKLKIRTRNTSGDTAFGLAAFTDQVSRAYAEKGYTPSDSDDFGLLLDLNIMYSGHIQKSYIAELGFLGGTAGRAYGQHGNHDMGPFVGTVAGATVGAIAGANVTEDTYMVVAQVTFGVVKKKKASRKRVTFSRSERVETIDDPDQGEEVYNRGFKKTYSTRLAVYAGGRNVSQADIAEGVKQRFARILGEFL